MTGSNATLADLKKLEHQLLRQKDDKQRIIILDQLASQYTYTNVRKAQKFLSDLLETLKRVPNADLKLNYHLNTAFAENQLYNYYLAEIHYKQAIEILEERGDIKQQAETYIDYAGTCINLDKRDLATNLLDKAAKLLEAFPDDLLEARLICREAFLQLHMSNVTKATELLLEAEKRINASSQTLTLKDYYFRSLIYSGLGNVHDLNDDIEKSVRAYLNVVNLCESIGMRTRLSWHYRNVGNAYMAMQDNESAEEYFRKAIRITDDISQHARAGAYANLGYMYFKKKLYEEALDLYKKAERLYKEKSDEDYANFAVIENWKATLYAALGKNKKAVKHFRNALEYAKTINDYRQLSNVCKDIAVFYADMEDYKSAYQYQLLHDEMGERYMEEVKRKTVWELEVKYGAEKRKREAELERMRATGLQLKALRAQMNPHFMYNALNSIQNYITSYEVNSAAKYLAKFAKLMRQSLDYSDLEIISLEKEVEFLQDYLFINQKLRFEDRLDFKINVGDDIEEDIMGVPTMIVQPYVENAIEHGLRSKKSGLVKLNFSLLDDNTILCVVEDNGIGREKAKELQEKDAFHSNHKSKGTSITEQRLEILHKSKQKGVFVNTIDLKEAVTGAALGTRVEIQIPVEIIQKRQ